jgi:hypothetical protein
MPSAGSPRPVRCSPETTRAQGHCARRYRCAFVAPLAARSRCFGRWAAKRPVSGAPAPHLRLHHPHAPECILPDSILAEFLRACIQPATWWLWSFILRWSNVIAGALPSKTPPRAAGWTQQGERTHQRIASLRPRIWSLHAI